MYIYGRACNIVIYVTYKDNFELFNLNDPLRISSGFLILSLFILNQSKSLCVS